MARVEASNPNMMNQKIIDVKVSIVTVANWVCKQ